MLPRPYAPRSFSTQVTANASECALAGLHICDGGVIRPAGAATWDEEAFRAEEAAAGRHREGGTRPSLEPLGSRHVAQPTLSLAAMTVLGAVVAGAVGYTAMRVGRPRCRRAPATAEEQAASEQQMYDLGLNDAAARAAKL